MSKWSVVGCGGVQCVNMYCSVYVVCVNMYVCVVAPIIQVLQNCHHVLVLVLVLLLVSNTPQFSNTPINSLMSFNATSPAPLFNCSWLF